MKDAPLVTVIVLNYNLSRWVLEALESIRSQTYKNVELIVVDDCSSDGSVPMIEAWIIQSRVKCTFIKHAINQGMCKSLNDALSIARGKYVSKVDADDLWLPEKTERQVKLMENQPENVAMVYGDALQIDENGVLLPQTFLQTRRHISSPPQGDIFGALWQENFIITLATLIRRSCFDVVGLYDEKLVYEDWDMFLRIARRFEVVFSPHVAVKYRIHSNSMVRAKSEKMEQSRVLIRLKFLEEYFQDLAATELISSLGIGLYRMHHPKRHRYLWKTFLAQKTAVNWLAFVCSVAGIKYNRFMTLVSLGVRTKGRLRFFIRGRRWLP